MFGNNSSRISRLTPRLNSMLQIKRGQRSNTLLIAKHYKFEVTIYGCKFLKIISGVETDVAEDDDTESKDGDVSAPQGLIL